MILTTCFLLVTFNIAIVASGGQKTKKEPDPKHVREWMNAEVTISGIPFDPFTSFHTFQTDFYKLEQELRKALGDEWESFRLYMSEKIQEHHSVQQASCQAPNTGPPAAVSPKPYDDCNGQAGLTESEYILHQAIDLYKGKIGDGTSESVHHYHNMAHSVFEKTRKLLEKMSLLQGSEYEDAAVVKQNDMRFRYKRLTPIIVTPSNGSSGAVGK